MKSDQAALFREDWNYSAENVLLLKLYYFLKPSPPFPPS